MFAFQNKCSYNTNTNICSGGPIMEQYKKPFHSFIQPLLNSLQFPTESTSFTPVMPLIDVVETIHNSYYFKKEITLLFEQYISKGELQQFTKKGIIKSCIQPNNHFVFLSEDLTMILNLEQVVSAIQV